MDHSAGNRLRRSNYAVVKGAAEHSQQPVENTDIHRVELISVAGVIVEFPQALESIQIVHITKESDNSSDLISEDDANICDLFVIHNMGERNKG